MRQGQDTLTNIGANLLKMRFFCIQIFIHVQTAVNLQLEGVDIFARLAVIEGNISAGVGAVELHPVLLGFQCPAQKF